MSKPGNHGEVLVLAIDIGSSSVRAMVFDTAARALPGHAAQISYDLDISADGGVTLDPRVLVDLVEACIDEVLAASFPGTQFSAVGVSCFWHSLIGLDYDGVPVTPIYHLADSRSADIVDDLRRDHDEDDFRAIGGTVFHSSYWPAKLLWLQQAEPELVRHVRQWTSGADYLMRCLTGVRTTSVCMASGTGMLDITDCEWSREIAALANVEIERLAPLVDRDEASELPGPYAARWPALAGVPWFPPLGDGACANVGSGAVRQDRIALTLGTTGAVRVLQEQRPGEAVEPIDGLWVYRLDRRSIVRGAAITNGGIWTDFLLETLSNGDMQVFDDAFVLPPAEHGLTILPFLAGERAPIWNDRARAVIAGLNPQTTPAEIMRAGFESVGHRMRLIYDLLTPAVEQQHMVLANGAALLKSEGWQQILASSLEHDVRTLPADLEASARGAAICALQSVGAIEALDDVEELSALARIVHPVTHESTVYAIERERQVRLQRLLYPQGGSWDS